MSQILSIFATERWYPFLQAFTIYAAWAVSSIFKFLIFSASSALGGVAATTLAFASLGAFCFVFWEVESFGSSLVKAMKSGAPGRYFRNGSGTLKPCKSHQWHPFAHWEADYLPLVSESSPTNSKVLSRLRKVWSWGHGHTSSWSPSATWHRIWSPDSWTGSLCSWNRKQVPCTLLGMETMLLDRTSLRLHCSRRQKQ